MIWLTVTLFVAYQLLVQMSFGIVRSGVESDLGFTVDLTNFLIMFYAVALGVMQLPVGLLLDRGNPRWLLTAACAAVVVGCALFASATNALMVAVGWTLAGFGSSFAFIGAGYVIRRWFPPRAFAVVFGGTILLSSIVGAGAGNVMYPALSELYSWRETLYGGAGLGVILTLLIALVVTLPEEDREVEMDTKHDTRSTPSIVSSFDAIFDRPQILFCALFAGATCGNLIGFGGLWLITWQAKGWQDSANDAAMLNSILWCGNGLGAPIFGLLSDMIRRRRIVMVLGSLAAFAFNVLLVVVLVPYSRSFLLWVLFLQGFAWGVAPLAFAVACENAPRRVLGLTLAVVNVFGVLMGSLLQIGPETMLDGIDNPGRLELSRALLPFVVTAAIGVLLAMFCIRETYCRSLPEKMRQARRVIGQA
ncbi:MFS transporter [Kolteria novifilia]|uniref:MFS transporter n=1 Tax=Kolteria novifilia TaxID=2527975 RepID=UPI003AF3F54E